MLAWLKQLRALWDLSGQLVELREQVEGLTPLEERVEALEQRKYERDRKADYRARKEEEYQAHAASQLPATPEGARVALIRSARAKGLM